MTSRVSGSWSFVDKVSGSSIRFRGIAHTCLLQRGYSVWVGLTLVGLCVGVVDFAYDSAINALVNTRVSLQTEAGAWGSYFVFCSWRAAFACAAVWATDRINKQATGSGMSELKCTMSGFEVGGFLSPLTLVSKFTGLVLSISSGMPMGSEGPFIHMSCIIANQIMRLPMFRSIRDNKVIFQRVLASGCAVGVAASFGARP